MAKAKKIGGLDCDTDAAEGAAKILRTRFEEMSELREIALDFSDSIGVHDIRVAMRRLRCAVRDMKVLFKKAPYKTLIKELKTAYDIIGDVRNEDVAISALRKMRTKTEDEIVRQGLDSLLRDHYESREGARDNLKAAFAEEPFHGIEEELDALLAAGGEEKKGKSLSEVGNKAVGVILKKFTNLSENLQTASDFEALHRFRIASKRLRCALDLFSPCWGNKVTAPMIEQVGHMQYLLGKVHDRDELLTDLMRRLALIKSKEVQAIDEETAKWIFGDLIKKRNKNYRAALQLWREWEVDGFIEKLRELVSQ
jgi:CHAD domain-containing protein